MPVAEQYVAQFKTVNELCADQNVSPKIKQDAIVRLCALYQRLGWEHQAEAADILNMQRAMPQMRASSDAWLWFLRAPQRIRAAITIISRDGFWEYITIVRGVRAYRRKWGRNWLDLPVRRSR